MNVTMAIACVVILTTQSAEGARKGGAEFQYACYLRAVNVILSAS
jgi:hypothetical protein